MSKTIDNRLVHSCAIDVTPRQTKQVLSKMKMPKIPAIAMSALHIINHASYSHLNTHK